MPALVPQVGGFLEATPLARLLVHALDSRFGGTLVLEEPGGFRHGVHFEAGVPRKAKTGSPVAYLGELLVEAGALSPSAYRSTLDRALAERRLHGVILLDERLVSERALDSALREQLSRQVLWMFGRPPETRFGFFPDANLLESWGAAVPARVHALELIWRGLRDHASVAEIEGSLAEVGHRPLILREDMPLDYFFFMGEDRAIVERLQMGALRLDELTASFAGEAERVQRVVCLLALARALDLGVRSAPPLGLDTNEPAPLSIPAPSRVPEVWSSRPPAAEPSSPPAVEPETTAPAMSEPEPEGPPPRIAESTPPAPSASSAASDPEAPPAVVADESSPAPRFDGALQPPQPRPSAIPDAVTANLHMKELARKRGLRPDATEAERVHAAASAFERAEALASHGNLTAAKRELSTALDHDPQPPYLAMNAWLDTQQPEPDLRSIARDLERAYRLAENHPTVRWYRGLVMQRLGKHAAALREFRFVVEKLPRHIDAARQVRIYEARLRASPKDRPSLAPADPAERPRSGLFSWLRRTKA
jgi:hypothetical protein